MKLGLFTYGYMRYPLDYAFRDAARFGYDGVEIWGGRPYAYPYDLKKVGVSQIKELSDEYEMPIIGYTPEMNMYPYNMMIGTESVRKDCIEYLKNAMDIAVQLDAGFTLISAGHAGYTVSRKTIWERLLKNLRELVIYAEEVGMDLVLEPLTHYESNVIVSCNDLVEALDLVGSPKLVGMCDVVPPFCLKEPIMSYFDKLGDRMRHIHLVDSDGQSDTHMMPGDGKIPLRELLREIETRSYDGYCTIELVSAYIHEPTLGSELAMKRVKELINS